MGLDNLRKTDAIEATNVEFQPLGVSSRRGWVSKFTSGGAGIIQDIKGWFGSNFHRLVYLGGTTDLRIYNLVTADDRTVQTLSAASEALAFSSFGVRSYVGGYGSASSGLKLPVGTAGPYALAQDPANPATIQSDTMWPAAPSLSNFTTFTQSSIGGTGITTPGKHRVWIIITTRTGYTCRPIDTGYDVNSVSDAFFFSFVYTGGLPATYASITLALSTADQPTNFYIPLEPWPGNNAGPAPLVAGTFGLTVGINDANLELGTPAFPYLSNFTQGTPFTLQPYIIKAYQQRMAYTGLIPETSVAATATQSGIFFSDAGAPQDIALSRSLVQLPNQEMITAGETLRGTYYAFGPGYTYAIQDNGGDPVTWPVPQLVDGGIGTQRPEGVYVSSKGFLWVADEDGLYTFDGANYPAKPVSYYQDADWWQRINWNAPQGAIRVVDASEDRSVYVLVPLDGATVPTHIFVWNYQYGTSAEAVRFSVITFDAWTRAFTRVLDPLVGTWRLIRGVSNAAWFRRLVSDADQTDNGTAVSSVYEHAPIPVDRYAPKRYHGFQARVDVPGQLAINAKNFTGSRSTALQGISAWLNQEITLTRFLTLQSEGLRLRFSGIGQWAMSSLKAWWEPWVEKRGVDGGTAMAYSRLSGPYRADGGSTIGGTVNGVNTVFTLPAVIANWTSDVQIGLGGLVLTRGSDFTATDGTNTFTMVVAPTGTTGENFHAYYWY